MEVTGLGLAITKGIIDMHGGKIIPESDLGKFTRFIILLPLTQKRIIH
jgi:signal transduction histidine kinase